jgi:hypothetical protein
MSAPTTSSILRTLLVATATAGVVVGCAGKKSRPASTQALGMSDFVAPPPDPDEEAAEPYALGAGDESLRDFDAFDTDMRQPLRSPEIGERVVVDSMVGHVNGRPIFADEFFVPIEDELIALARSVDRRTYMKEAGEIVGNELRQVILNSLFLAEAESSLSNEEKLGVRAWLNSIREGLIAGSGGSETAARQELQASGETVESRLDDIRDRALIRKVIDEKISPGVIVSWSDIEREFERQYEQFNPPGTATLGRIRLRTQQQADLITDVQQRLDAGEPFLEVAESLDVPGVGVWQTFEIGGEEGEGLIPPSIQNETVRANMASLARVGDTTSAFQVGGTTWWVHVVDVEQPPQVSLYDPQVQRQLSRYLRAVRGNEEQNKFISTLLERGIYDELDAMAERLLAIAVLRYGPTS